MNLFEAFNAFEDDGKSTYAVRSVGNVTLTPPMLTKDEAEKLAAAYNNGFSLGMFDVLLEGEPSNEVLLEQDAMWVLWKHLYRTVSANTPTRLAVRKSVFDAVEKLRTAYLELKEQQGE